MTFKYVISTILIFSAGNVMAARQACPRFSEYPVKEKFAGPYKSPNINQSQDVRMFRTVIREGARGKPDFAGHYRVVRWGCGSNCHVFALVDKKSGKVFFFQESRR